jgi:hypothetical protein
MRLTIITAIVDPKHFKKILNVVALTGKAASLVDAE